MDFLTPNTAFLCKSFYKTPKLAKIAESWRKSPRIVIITLAPGLLGTFSFVVLDTDYENFAIFCSCKPLREPCYKNGLIG
jgi:hypothetical protein